MDISNENGAIFMIMITRIYLLNKYKYNLLKKAD